MSDQAKNIQKIDTIINADSVEWCPFIGYKPFLLCGTYKLQESEQTTDESRSTECETDDKGEISKSDKPQVRVGGVSVYTLSTDEGFPHLCEASQTPLCGILDIKWFNEQVHDEKALFGLVDAEGYFQLMELDQGSGSASCVSKAQLTESSLGLSLGWSPACSGCSFRAAASDSAGCLTVFDVSDGDIRILSTWEAHGYEAWITAFHNTDKNILYSGGDDCCLKRWDIRNTTRPTFNSRRHQMGVCSIQSHPFKEHIFATGSYDEDLNIWDDRQLKKPMAYSSLGGGVWRIKWDPFQGDFILTATMYNGTHIIDCRQLEQTPLPILTKYDDHNLAYGADWCRLLKDGSEKCEKSKNTVEESEDKEDQDIGQDDVVLISTCSFYDHALHLWEWQMPT